MKHQPVIALAMDYDMEKDRQQRLDAYPRLVEALRDLVKVEAHYAADQPKIDRAIALLRELGED